MLEGISLDLAIESFSFLFHQLFSLYKGNYKKMELRFPHMLHLFNIFRENDGKENCAQVLEEDCNKMFGTRSLNDEHDCNVVSMNSLNIHSTNDDCTSYDENVSYKHVNFVEYIGFASTHQIGKIDIARGISI